MLPVEDNTSSILEAVKTQAIVQKTGGGTGFSFSKLRPEGDQVGSTGSVASGPVSFMQLFDKCTQVIKQGGKRRGANMGILSIEHPDITEFIEMKRNNMNLDEHAKIMKEFNISVAITEKFMSELKNNEDHKFINPRTGNEVLKCEDCGKNVFLNNENVFEGPINSLRHYKDNVREAGVGTECGIALEGFDDFQQDDVIEVYRLDKPAR